MPVFKPYKYIKESPAPKSSKKKEDVWKLNTHLEPLSINWKQALSTVFVASGLFLLTTQILLPWLTTPRAQTPLLKPTTSTILGVEEAFQVEFEFTELKQENPEADATHRYGASKENIPEIFYLSIPKLGIERAEVETNSQDLSPDERLGHYAGSALPGETGNTFIYGHSVLPVFYNPKNYRTIFSTLDKLEKGDEVKVEFGEKVLRYVVEKAAVVKPEDVRPLEPTSPFFLRDSYLTLMTCVPMGLGTNRLLVQSRLTKEF